MAILNVCPAHVHINPDDFQTGVAEYPLQREDITTITQVADSECMPESVRRAPDSLNTGPPCIFFNYRSETVSGYRITGSSQEQGRAERVGRLGSVFLYVFPDCPLHPGSDGYEPFLTSLAEDFHHAVFKVNVVHGKSDKLTGPQSGIKQR